MASNGRRIGESYDFIVCGGGTAGCVVAGRLAEHASTSILVLEAGSHTKDLESVHMPGGWSQNFDKSTDWNILSQKGKGVNDRQMKLTSGKFLGGCSGCNGMVCVRGSRQDYDDWGVPGWSGDELFQYMSKAELFKAKPWFPHSKESHGYDGHLSTEPFELAPISELVLTSMQSKGFALDPDMFSHGANPHGCGHVVRSVSSGIRSTSADFMANKKNITILNEVIVDKVAMEKDDKGHVRAAGVHIVQADGSKMVVRANKEVIVSGGAYCSPNILNRSGIGAKHELEKHGISTVVDLPGVGKNLTDHLLVFMFYETDKPGLTNDHLVHHGDGFSKSYQLWKDEKKGFLSGSPFGVFAFARLDARLADSQRWSSAPRRHGRDPMDLAPSQPNAELFSTECYGGPKLFDRAPTDGQHVFGMVTQLFAARSRGTVSLGSADPMAVPVVDSGYLTHPLDVEVLAEACRLSNEIILEGSGTKDIVKGPWPPEASHLNLLTREDWIEFVKENVTTGYHAGGTCAMGTTSNPDAVVDENLCVKGVKGLRVVDCSIMPLLNGGHTQMPVYGIGEKAADLIKATWSLTAGSEQA